MPRAIPYNRKINAPIKFLHYLEPFDLFVIGILGFLLPMAATNFLPVDFPAWHLVIWLLMLTFTLVILKVGKAPGYIQHYLLGLFRPTLLQPGKKSIRHYLLDPKQYEEERVQSQWPDQPITAEELSQIQQHLTVLKQDRKQEKVMAAHTATLT